MPDTTPTGTPGRLDENPFDYRATKDGRVFISWCGRQVTVLAGKRAQAFLHSIGGKQGRQAQLVMAKATGNFKRGNER